MKKKLLLSMIVFLAFVGWSSVASAQTTQGFENGSFPSGWYSPGNGFTVVNYHAHTGSYSMRGDKDAYLVLSSGSTPISSMTLEMYVKNASQSNQSMAHLYIGYVTNQNDMSTFQPVSPVFYQGDYTWVRVGFAGAPAGARIAIYSYCYQPQYNQLAYSWYIDDVLLRSEPTQSIVYGNSVNPNERAYIEGFESIEDGTLPDGWLYNVSSQPSTFTTGSTNPLSGSKCLKGKGYVILPKANGVETNNVMVDLFVNKNSTSSASMQIGYVTNTNDMSTFVPVRTLIHQTGYRYARVDFAGAPAGARIAIRTTGNTEWYIDNLYMFDCTELNPSFVYQFNQGFEQVTLNFVDRLPRGWLYLSDDGLSPFWTTSTSHHTGQYSLRGTDGYLVLPPSELNLSSYSMDYWLAANQWQGGFDYFEAGYMTDPDDVNTFVSLEIVLEDITDFKFHRVNFDGVPSGARIAFHIYASNPSLYMTWYLDDISVYQTPQVQYLPYSEYFTGQTSGDILPQGWNDNGTCSVTSDKRLSAVGDAKVSMLKMVTGGTVQWDLMAKPVTAQSSGSFSLGYVTTQNMKDFDFHSVKTFNNKSSWTDFQPRSVLFTIPAGAYPAIQTVSSNWFFDNIRIYQPTIKTLPLTEGFENLDGGLPSGWLGESAYTSGSDDLGNPYEGTVKLNIRSMGYAALPEISTNSYDHVFMDLWLKPTYLSGGVQMQVGYVTAPNDPTTFHCVQVFNASSSWTAYQKKTVSMAGVPAGARLAFKTPTNPVWLIDNIRVYSAMEMPYFQDFASSSLPEGWGRYTGQVQRNGSIHTATLTPSDYSWSFGQQNGVFDSHAYATIGGNNAQYKWLVSPSILLDDEDDPFVTFKIGMSRAQGNQVPLVWNGQEHQYVAVFVTDNDGLYWRGVKEWGPNAYNSTQVLNPTGSVYSVPLALILNEYKNKIIKIGFYVECTDAGDLLNNVHLDDFSVQHYDFTLPPQSVTVSEVSSHTAKVSWESATYAQMYWELMVTESWWNPSYQTTPEDNHHFPSIGNGIINHNFSYTVTGLTANKDYKAWVRYSDYNGPSDWLSSDAFTTVANCAPPTNVQVETTMHKIFVSWDPGQSNQTSWTVNVSGDDYWEYPATTTSIEIDATGMLLPGEPFEVSVEGTCTDGDGSSFASPWVQAQMQPYPTLTVNDGQEYSSEVVVLMDGLGYGESWSQFIIPASQLTNMQYSTINQLQFYCDKNHTEWNNEQFSVYLKEVDFDDLGDYCENEFYGGDMSLCYNGALSVASNHVMTITLSDANLFHYHDGNLLVGIFQDTQDQNTQNPQFTWAGVATSDDAALAPEWHDIPYCVGFRPKMTFTFETDDYLPPTNFQAYVTGGYDVSFSWTMRDGQTATEIGICVSPDFIGDQTLTNSTDSQCGVSFPNFFEPEETYYYHYRGIYEVDGVTYYSGWSVTGSFTMPDACENPTNLQATDVTESSVHFSWNHNSEYDELEYRESTGNYQTAYSCNFNATASVNDWIIQSNETNTWERTLNSETNYVMLSTIEGTEGIHNHWLITPQIELPGRLSFRAKRGQNASNLKVYVSVTDTQTSSFTLVGTYTLTSTYRTFTVDLSAYSGVGYVAFRHEKIVLDPSVGSTPLHLAYVDDVVYKEPVFGDWLETGTSTVGQLNLLGLTPGTTYQARVKSHCNTGYTSDWSAPVSFTTLKNIVFEDANVKARCLSAWDGILGEAPDGELSYAEAAAVTDLGTAFYEATDITSFNELQYFTGLTAIRQNAFRGCSSLSAVTLPNTITTIGYNAFGSNSQTVGCTNLTSILIPQGVTSIQEYAFQHSGLTEISFPPSVTTISILAFGYCDDLTTVYLPATVTTLSGNAFTGASLASIEVDPDNPVYDSRNSCNAIIETATNILKTGCMNTVIPEGVTTLGTSCFELCSGLTSLTLPASVSEIKDFAFADCSHLASLKVLATTPPTLNVDALVGITPANIKVFVPCGSFEAYENSDWSAFNLVEDCNIDFADYQVEDLCVANWDTDGDGGLSYSEAAAVTSLGTVFRENMSIWSFNELQYFTGLTVLDGYAFFRCFTLVSVTLPPTMTTISNHAFYFCPLTALTIPESVTTIGNYAFGATDLASLDIPATVTEIGMNPVIHCSALSTLTVAASNPVYSDGGGNAIIETATHKLISGCQSTVIPDGVTTIGANAFAMLNTLTSVTLPASVASIEIGAFCYSPNIARIFVDATTPPVMTDDAFYGVSKDIPVYVPCNSLGYYEDDDYWGLFTNILSDCEYINFADANVKAICVANWDTDGDGELSYREAALVTTLNVTGDDCASVFKYNSIITSFDELQYFTGLTTIDPYAFFNCFDLASVTLPSTLETLGNYCFENCMSLTSVEIPNSVTVIDDGVFFGCSGITSFEIPASVTALSAWSFSGTGLTSVYLPAWVNSLEQNVFAQCPDLVSLAVDPDNTTFDSRGDCNAIIQTSTNTLKSACINTVIPDDVTTIGVYAFAGCTDLTSVTIPGNVTNIQSCAFENCTGLTRIIVEAVNPPLLQNYAFQYVSTDVPVIVPCGSQAAYQSATNWSAFTHISGDCIVFADPDVKAICVANWDTDGDGELSHAEAAAVTSLSPSGQSNQSVFTDRLDVDSFDELQYFTGLTQIRGYAFYGCSNMTSIVLPAGITEIWYHAFENCTSLQGIQLPEQLNWLGSRAFFHCSGLTGGLRIPGTVTRVQAQAFHGCTGLTSLMLESGVSEIEGDAFYDCLGLKQIWMDPCTPPTLDDSFDHVDPDVRVYVPCLCLDNYLDYNSTGQPWGGFANILGQGCDSEEQTLAAGWNWFAPMRHYMVSELETALGDHAVLINTQDGGFARYENGSWSGTLQGDLLPGRMLKILNLSSVTLSLYGPMFTRVTVSIEPGANWIGYTGPDNPIEEALGDFVPHEGDKLVYRSGTTGNLTTLTATFINNVWTGNLTTLEKGKGYVYISADTQTKTMVFMTDYEQ